jgi:YidC/Oxa1 family membrane protein insertase
MKQKYKYLVVVSLLSTLLILTACLNNTTQQNIPIVGFYRFWDFLVWPMAFLLYLLGKSIAFSNYAIMIILATIIVRSAAWPIYAKTNDMTIKMEMMRPEQEKIEKKYANRNDQESKTRKQMEIMQLYKKYGVGLSGCLGPLLQFPIFIAFYETLRRIPQTINGITVTGEIVSYPLNFGVFDHTIFGLNLFEGRVGAFFSNTFFLKQNIWIYILCILVAVTQIFTQILISRRQKRQQEKVYSDLPDYRRPAQTPQQIQQKKIMQVMMYGMALMMVVFVFNSAAALGLYWFIGNLYTAGQSYISYKLTDKRKEKIQNKFK